MSGIDWVIFRHNQQGILGRGVFLEVQMIRLSGLKEVQENWVETKTKIKVGIGTDEIYVFSFNRKILHFV